MDALQIKHVLADGTPGWEPRDYLGMDVIGQCELKLYRDLRHEVYHPGIEARRLYHEGCVHEADVLDRLREAGLPVHLFGHEVVAGFDARFRGFVDGILDGAVIEIKAIDAQGFLAVRRRGEVPRHRVAVQALMWHGHWGRAFLIYKCRNSGELWVCEVERDEEEGERIEAKARRILRAVDEGRPPACECGRCGDDC